MRRHASLDEEPPQKVAEVRRTNAPTRLQGEALAGALIDNGEDCLYPSASRAIAAEVHRPGVFRPLGFEADDAAVGRSQVPPLVPIGQDLQAVLAADAGGLLAVDPPASGAEPGSEPAIAESRPETANGENVLDDRLLHFCHSGRPAMCGSALAKDLAGPTLAGGEGVAEVLHRAASRGQTQNSPSCHLLEHCDAERLVGEHGLETGVLGLELLEPLGFARLYPAALAPLPAEGTFGDLQLDHDLANGGALREEHLGVSDNSR